MHRQEQGARPLRLTIATTVAISALTILMAPGGEAALAFGRRRRTSSPSGPPGLLDSLWQGRARFRTDQPTVPVRAATSGHREACAVPRPDISPNTVYLYHRIFDRGSANPSIGLSISSDGGDSWPDYRGEVVAPAQGHVFAVAPSVAKVGRTWVMVYEESNVAQVWWAESNDGLRWSVRGALIPHGRSGSWDAHSSGTPGIFVDTNGRIYVFYASYPSTTDMRGQIGFLSGRSMRNLRKSRSNPVLTRGLGWDRAHVSMPRIIKESGYYYMVYEGADTDFSCGSYNRYGYGLARSTDLIHWQRFSGNPLGTGNRGCGVDMPSFFKRPNGTLFIYHTSRDRRRIVREVLVP